MQDSDILPTHYAYMFRYDLNAREHAVGPDSIVLIGTDWFPWDDPAAAPFHLEEFKKMISADLPFIEYYIAGWEISAKTKKPHIQSIVWSPTKLATSNMQKARNYILTKYKWKCNKGKVAFSSAKKVKTLAAYSAKDGKVVHNLPDDIYGKIPNWRPWEHFNKDKKSLLERNLKKYKLCTLDFRKFAQIMNLEYQNVYGSPCNRRNVYYTFAYKLGVIDNENYLERIGVIPTVYRSYETLGTYISDDYKKNRKL